VDGSANGTGIGTGRAREREGEEAYITLVIIEKTYCNFSPDLSGSNGSLLWKRRFGSFARDPARTNDAGYVVMQRRRITFLYLTSEQV